MTKGQIQLPKDALSRINLGQSFAEYDRILTQPNIFVTTPAIQAALSPSRNKCFFVGRRGTGKTAITYHLSNSRRNVLQLLPQTFAPLGINLDLAILRDTRQRPFRSLVSCFKRALYDQVLALWHRDGHLKFDNLPPSLTRERNVIEDLDFDIRTLTFIEEALATLSRENERDWLRFIRRQKDIGDEVEKLRRDSSWDYTILLDRVDESWDGSDQAVILLMALMHACVELNGSLVIRPLLFLRENLFERVREMDNEFARLETFVIGLDWTRELLLEMIERRLNLPFNTKLPLGGRTWEYFFENTNGTSSQDLVFEYCQERPRDVLTYCSFAIESAQSKRHLKVQIEDLQAARRRFSESRFKDLGDEYSENYPQIQLVLARFYGLGREFSVSAISSFIKKLILDENIKHHCARWIFNHTTPEMFVQLFYNIGFFGIREGNNISYRSSGVKSSALPPITATTHVVVHPSYADALNLQDIVIGGLDEERALQQAGLISEVPDALDLNEYTDRLVKLENDLKALPTGWGSSSQFEEIVGEIIKLCFFTSLTNVEPKVRDVEGRVIRDWIAANRASIGFWEMIRHRYQATQIIWECKNFEDLDAAAFQQSSYYMTKEIGRFVVVCFRGKVEKHYYQHIKRIAGEKEGGIVLLLTDRDLMVFLRQARNGKAKEDHIRDIYDRTVREIS